jgi:hypothetical protein
MLLFYTKNNCCRIYEIVVINKVINYFNLFEKPGEEQVFQLVFYIFYKTYGLTIIVVSSQSRFTRFYRQDSGNRLMGVY